ncbi:D-alanyl-D-alanine carboxypeptidase [Lachnospiraceae bacterium RM5]|nr:D-alanyl-D-alanine carboxypeptidase [Lachnospiraceae bacterium RM5]
MSYRLKYILLSVIIFLMSVLPCYNAYADEEVKCASEKPEIYAECGVLLDASTNTVLYDKNCHQQMYPASITKILTTLVALEEGNLTDMVHYYHYDVYSLEYGDAHIGRQEGEELSLKDSLYAVMLASANECSYAVAEYVARKTDAYTEKIETMKKEKGGAEPDDEAKSIAAIEVFSDIMNERAKKAGALNSNFCNPNGLFNENHYTSCYDMAMITKDAIKNDTFLEIESNTTYQIPATNLQPETQYIANRHKMLYPDNENYYEGILGGKTGFVTQSGNTLVTFVKRGDTTLISVVMNSNAQNVYNDTKLLLDYGFNNYSDINPSESEKCLSDTNDEINASLKDSLKDYYECLSYDTSSKCILPNNISLSDCTKKIESCINFTDINSLDLSTCPTTDACCIGYYYNNIKVGNLHIKLDNKKASEIKKKIQTKHEEKISKEKKSNFIKKLLKILIFIIILLIIIYVIGIILINRRHK